MRSPILTFQFHLLKRKLKNHEIFDRFYQNYLKDFYLKSPAIHKGIDGSPLVFQSLTMPVIPIVADVLPREIIAGILKAQVLGTIVFTKEFDLYQSK